MIVAWVKPGLTESQRAVREHFSTGGSYLELFLLFLALVACVVILSAVRRRQKHAEKGDGASDPDRLFNDLMDKLVSAEPQRQFLARVATTLALEHPSILLFTPGLFDKTMDRWRKRRPSPDRDSQSDEEALVRQIRQDLFGVDRPT